MQGHLFRLALILILVFCLSSTEAGKCHGCIRGGRRQAELKELCNDDPTCIETGKNCNLALKRLRNDFEDDEDQGKDKMDRQARKQMWQEKMANCSEESGLEADFEEMKQQKQDGDEGKQDGDEGKQDGDEGKQDGDEGKQDGDEGRRGRKMKGMMTFMKNLDETKPEEMTVFRCCMMNKEELMTDGVFDTEKLKAQMRDTFSDAEDADMLATLESAVDTCEAPVDCKFMEYKKCVVRSCMGL